MTVEFNLQLRSSYIGLLQLKATGVCSETPRGRRMGGEGGLKNVLYLDIRLFA